ncbi:hypothetical protein CFC21_099170, partial [Triticum aestivum]
APEDRHRGVRQLRAVPGADAGAAGAHGAGALPLRPLGRRGGPRRVLLRRPARPLRVPTRRGPPGHLHPLHGGGAPLAPRPPLPPQHALRRRALRQGVPQEAAPQPPPRGLRHRLHAPHVRPGVGARRLGRPPVRVRQGPRRRLPGPPRARRGVPGRVRARGVPHGGDALRGARRARRRDAAGGAHRGADAGHARAPPHAHRHQGLRDAAPARGQHLQRQLRPVQRPLHVQQELDGAAPPAGGGPGHRQAEALPQPARRAPEAALRG